MNSNYTASDRRLPEEKFRLLIEVARRSLLMCELLVQRLDAELRAVEPYIGASADLGDRVVPAFLSATGFIDFAHRFGEVVDSLPLISRRASECGALRNALAPVVIGRNYLQHLRNELNTNGPIEFAAMGVIGWTREDRAYSALFSQCTKMTVSSQEYNPITRRWNTRLQYQIKTQVIDFDATLAAIQTCYDWIAETMAPRMGLDLFEKSWGRTQAFALRFGAVPRLDTAATSLIQPLG
jgi:hypothetical protein